MKFVIMDVVNADFSSLEGTCCYCSAESAALIRQQISATPLRALHLIGTGDYHYVSLFFLERIADPFELVLYDHHPDDQAAAFGGELLSCGSWVREARRLPMLGASYLVRHSTDLHNLSPGGLPVYISLDLDVLSPEYARTDWDQGDLTLKELQLSLDELAGRREIVGADICGGITRAQGGTDADIALNRSTYRVLKGWFSSL